MSVLGWVALRVDRGGSPAGSNRVAGDIGVQAECLAEELLHRKAVGVGQQNLDVKIPERF